MYVYIFFKWETDMEPDKRSNRHDTSGPSGSQPEPTDAGHIHFPLLDEQFQTVSFLAKSLSDENRLRILLCIGSRKKSVGSIVEELGLSQPLVSHHLKELKRSLLVRIERSGPFIYYELSDPRILNVVRMLTAVATDLIADRKTF
jgi:DNA-binding transcriptional ArsR family regulator